MSQAAESSEEAARQREQVLEQVWEKLETQDTWTATAFVESQGKPQDVADLYSNLVRDLYGKKHDVPRMMLIGRSGIGYCLRESTRAENGGDDKLAAELRGMAKVMSYNVSVNTWPAWEDEGIVVNRSDQRIGLDLARLNQRLAKELKRGPDKLGNAHWLLGAHQLALGKHDDAIEHFRAGVKLLVEARKPDFELMCRGYVAIAKLDRNRQDEAAQREFDETVSALEKLNVGDAGFFAKQLTAVNAYFAK